MDSRIRRHAELLVDRCTDVGPGDMVLVEATPEADDLVTALYEEIGERGGMPMYTRMPSRGMRAFAEGVDSEDLETPEHLLASLDAADVYVRISASRNVSEVSDLDPEDRAALAKVYQPLGDAQESCRWVATQYPAPANAQRAEMSTAAYEEFVWNAVDKDWDAQREFQENLVEILDPADEVWIRAGDETDVTMSVDGNHAVNDYGEINMPGGEVYTAPVVDSVEGTVRFDKPVIARGQEIEGAYLEFEDGVVVDHDAEKNADALAGILETDEGARRVGELGIGMNRDIDRFTYNMLFDEKMGDTVHLALGRAYDDTVGEDNEQNESAVHEDMIVDTSEDSSIEVDGEVVQRDGQFVFEEQ
jgi:aminopeptidase